MRASIGSVVLGLMAITTAGMAGCSGPGAQAPDAGATDDAPAQPDPPSLQAYGERCGNDRDDDGDGLIDEDCEPSLFSGVFAPTVAADPALAAIEAAAGRTLAVLQTYHSTSPAGVARIAPDLAAIFTRGQVAHLNLEPAGYARAAYAMPAADPIAHDLHAAADALASALAAAPGGRVLLTFGAEMNGQWTGWGCLPAAQYIALYRAAHAQVASALVDHQVDARRVRWAFGPDARGSAGCPGAAAYYPGHAYVDLLGMSAYRSGAATVEATVLAPMTALFTALDYPAAWQRDRFIVLQTGSRDLANDDRSAWVASLFSELTADPRIAGLIYFDAADWAIDEGGHGWTGLTAAIHVAPVADRQLAGIFEPRFWDVAYADPAFPEIQALRDNLITTGCASAPDRFCPNELLHRRDAARMVARAFSLPDGTTLSAFQDIATDDPDLSAIQALVERGAVSGCRPHQFCPDEPIRESDLAAMLAALGSTPPTSTTEPATRARGAILIAHAAQLVPHAP